MCERYVDFVKQNVGPVVVFDGCGNGLSTKDSADQRRTRGIAGSKIRGFSGNKLLMTTKENFLSNKTNKSNFILLLKHHLESRGVRTKQATGDADCLISETGIDLSSLGPTFVIGEDTDLLVILCHYANRAGTLAGRLCEPIRKMSSINCGILDVCVIYLAKMHVQIYRLSTQLLGVMQHLVSTVVRHRQGIASKNWKSHFQ